MTGRAAVLAAMAMAVATVATVTGPRAAPQFVWNVSASAPTGLYRVRPVAHLTVTTLVVAYPPEPLATRLDEGRYLPRGVPLLKPVLALSGQTVCRSGPVITVDGRDMGVARERDRSGRLLPVWQGCRVIGEREVLLMKQDDPASLDGRYFGPIPLFHDRRPRRPALDVRREPMMPPRYQMVAPVRPSDSCLVPQSAGAVFPTGPSRGRVFQRP